jgi:large subunit ribosomal protein L28
MQCDICGKKPAVGIHYTHRGKAKYLGGNGVKVTGWAKRIFRPNLQRMQIEIKGHVQTARVCVQCMRSGLVQRPTRRKLFQMPGM